MHEIKSYSHFLPLCFFSKKPIQANESLLRNSHSSSSREKNHVQTFCIFYGFVKQKIMNHQPWKYFVVKHWLQNLAHNFSMAIKLMFNSQTYLIRLGQLLILFSDFCNSSSDLIRPLVVFTFAFQLCLEK